MISGANDSTSYILVVVHGFSEPEGGRKKGKSDNLDAGLLVFCACVFLLFLWADEGRKSQKTRRRWRTEEFVVGTPVPFSQPGSPGKDVF
jgi:hypothetical protein